MRWLMFVPVRAGLFLHCHHHHRSRAVRLAAVQNGHDMDMRDEVRVRLLQDALNHPLGMNL